MDHPAEEKKCFSVVVLSEEDIAAWSSYKADGRFYGCRPGDPYIEKWFVQESPRGERKRSFGIVEGGDEPNLNIENRTTEVRFIGLMHDGTVLASSGENGSTFTFTPTQEDVMEGFSLAVSSMEEGEKALFNIPAKLALTKSGCPGSILWNIPPNQAFWLYIELVAFTTDILGDQGIIRRTKKIGEGNQHPCDLDEVFVNYNVFLEDGTLVSKSEGVEFKLADGFFCPAFSHALKTMTKGDEVFLVIKPQYGFGECGRLSGGNEIVVPPDSTLHVNLQLMSWKTVTHIGENGEIIKTTFSRAKFGGRHAQKGAFMSVRLIGKLQDGTVIDRRGHDGQAPVQFSFQDDKEKIVDGVKEAIMTMVEGDIALVTIPPHHAFGTVESNPYQLAVVPPNSVIIYEIELLWVETMPRVRNLALARRKLKHDHERCERLMMAIPPAARQENARQLPISAVPAVVGGPATSTNPAAGGSSTTTANENQSTGFSFFR